MQRIRTSGNYPFAVAFPGVAAGDGVVRVGMEQIVEKPVTVGLELAPSCFYNCPFPVVTMIKRIDEA